MIDPSIALQIHPMQIENPAEAAGKVMNLLALKRQIEMQPIQMQAAQENLKASQMENQQRQQSITDDQKARDFFSKNPNATPEDMITALGPKVAHPIIESIYKSQEAKLKTAGEKLDVMGRIAGSIKDEPSYHQGLDQAMQAGVLSPDDAVSLHRAGYTPQTAALIQQKATEGMKAKEQLDANLAQLKDKREALTSQQTTELQPFKVAEAKAKQEQVDRENVARQHPDDPAAQAAAMDAKDRVAKAQRDTELAQQLRHNLSTESTAKVMAGVAQGRLDQEKLINGMKYGPGTQEYWVQQISENPDSIKEMPAELRSSVGQAFSKKTGLPLPTALSGQTQQQETAARNALDSISAVQQILKNPNIQKQLGPIMGRLQNVEERVGTATGLSPEDERQAQELRTRMRYLVFQEGRAVLGGRLPTQLMTQLEASSPNVKMDPNMLAGSMDAVGKNAESIMDNADRQRFGGKMRPRSMRQTGPSLPQGGGKVIDTATAQQFYQAAGNDPAKARQMAADAGWKIQ